ncbi:MAG: hypothetical protein AAB590_01625 [Patescibacteria group bacterium]
MTKDNSVEETIKEAVKEAVREEKAKERWERTLNNASPKFIEWYFGCDQAPDNGLGSR